MKKIITFAAIALSLTSCFSAHSYKLTPYGIDKYLTMEATITDVPQQYKVGDMIQEGRYTYVVTSIIK